jgi:parvulin-like peptidyl-prolyl isomerase
MAQRIEANRERTTQDPLRPLLLLALGAALGLLIAATGLLETAEPDDDELPDEAAARINDSFILAADYERLLEGLRNDRIAVDAEGQRRVLDRMIDEELLVQRGLELGLATRDRKIRGDLSAEVIRAVVVEADGRVPSPGELENFFEREKAFFVRPGRVRAQQIFFRVRKPGEDEVARRRADAALERLRSGEDFATVQNALGDPVVSSIPDTLLPPAKLREYVGPTALEAVLELEPGVPSEPVRSGAGYHLLRVVAREPASEPEYFDFEPQIRAEWRRRVGDDALRSYLDELRERAVVVVRPELK